MYKHLFKRNIDIILALIALPFWLVILMIVGPIIYFEDKGSIFYNAPRLGKDCKVFKMYKFRSMKMNAPDIRNEDGSTFNSYNDPRLTKIGKFIRKTSIDETPQLLNVIKGDMAIVGPRPDLPEAINYYTDNQARKLEIKPGITGYSQAFFRNSITAKNKFENDVFYVDNISIFLDLSILFITFKNVFTQRNVFLKKVE